MNSSVPLPIANENIHLLTGDEWAPWFVKAVTPVAQWIEHPPPKGRVTRSIRVGGTTHAFQIILID